MNALLAESSLPPVKNGKLSKAGDSLLPRSNPLKMVADEVPNFPSFLYGIISR